MIVVDNPAIAGTPYIGRARTIVEAVGWFFLNNQEGLGIDFTVDESAQPAEEERRAQELARR